MDKKKLITKIIFGEEDLSKVNFPVDEEIKQNFEIGWDIWENFEDIKKQIRKKVVNKLYENLKEKYKEYEIINKGFLEGERYGRIYLYPQYWQRDKKNNPLFSYAFEYNKYNYSDILYGIAKEDDNNPYTGKIPENFNELKEIQEKLNNKFIPSEYYLVWRFFEEPYKGMLQREFYYKVFDNIESVISYYINELESLIKMTKNNIDQFIEEYKK